MTEKDSLSAKKQRVIASLVAGKTIAEAASDCHVSESQIYRWKREQVFRDGYQVAKREVLDRALEKLIRYTSAAIDTLARNMVNDTGAVASIRSVQVRAAQAILDASVAYGKMSELETQIAELQAILKAREP